jgi:hypothetical protein
MELRLIPDGTLTEETPRSDALVGTSAAVRIAAHLRISVLIHPCGKNRGVIGGAASDLGLTLSSMFNRRGLAHLVALSEKLNWIQQA